MKHLKLYMLFFMIQLSFVVSSCFSETNRINKEDIIFIKETLKKDGYSKYVKLFSNFTYQKSINGYQLYFYRISFDNIKLVVFVKKEDNKGLFYYKNWSQYNKFNYPEVINLLKENPDCYLYLDTLPILRESDTNLNKVASLNYQNIEQFNNLLDFISLNRYYYDDYYYLVYITQIFPLYFNYFPENNYEPKRVWRLFNGDYYNCFDFEKHEEFIKYIRTISYQGENPWINKNMIYLKDYFTKKQEDIFQPNIFYIETKPDEKIFKFKVDSNGYIITEEYINWQYNWFDPFNFFYKFNLDEF